MDREFREPTRLRLGLEEARTASASLLEYENQSTDIKATKQRSMRDTGGSKQIVIPGIPVGNLGKAK